MAGSSNFQVWGPCSNIETDSQYTSDPLRQSGASGSPTEFTGALANKLFQQLSMMVAGLGQMMATKGYTVNDGNLTQLAAVLANIVTQADIPAPFVTIPYSSTIVLNAAGAGDRTFRVALSGNVTSSTIQNATAGQKITIALDQDATGNRLFSFPSTFQGAGIPLGQPNSGSIQIFQAIDNNGGIVALAPMANYNV